MAPAPTPGYIPRGQIPDSATLLPPPPAPGSAAQARDEEVHDQLVKLRGTARWDLAHEDAKIRPPDSFRPFACAIGLDITEQTTPELYRLLRSAMADAGQSTPAAKRKYLRTRPFVVHNEPSCTPEDEAVLRTDGSYPSGHTAAGWGVALVLTEVVPDRANAILARGRAFGESRMVCNMHWQSDVEAARFMAASTVARMHAEAAFTEDMAKARAEVAALRAKGATTTRDCAAEAAALALKAGE